jgi:signal transduction histidine kinase
VNPDARPATADLPWLAPLALVVLIGTWFTNVDELSRGESAGAVACAGVAVAGLLAALWVPRAGALLTSLAVATFVILDFDEGPIYLTLAAVSVVAASRLEIRRWALPVYAGAALVLAALLLRGREHGGGVDLLAVVGVMTAGGAIGTLVRNRQLESRERARAAAAEEQLRMARDLHDGVGHGLAVIAMQAGVGLHVLDKEPAAVREALEAIRDTARESLEALRAELSQLTGDPASRRPLRGLDDLPLLLDRVRAAGPEVVVLGSWDPLPERVDATAYAVVQEALTNVLKHASATTVTVSLASDDDKLTIRVVDDGHGGSAPDEGLGLRGMRDRVEALAGSLTAGPGSGGGFEVRAVLPL